MGYWVLAIFLCAIPLLNLAFMVIFAFAGGNQTKKNFYRANLVWVAIFVGIHAIILLALFGMGAIDVLGRIINDITTHIKTTRS